MTPWHGGERKAGIEINQCSTLAAAAWLSKACGKRRRHGGSGSKQWQHRAAFAASTGSDAARTLRCTPHHAPHHTHALHTRTRTRTRTAHAHTHLHHTRTRCPLYAHTHAHAHTAPLHRLLRTTFYRAAHAHALPLSHTTHAAHARTRPARLRIPPRTHTAPHLTPHHLLTRRS